MAKKIFACLCGNWVNLSEDPECVIGGNHSHPNVWWEENAEIWSPSKRDEHTMYQLDHVNIHYKGSDYRIHPMFIQIVSS